MPDLRYLPWRVGRSVGRTIYAVLGDGLDDVLIGLMDDRGLAEIVVESHNACLESTYPVADDLG